MIINRRAFIEKTAAISATTLLFPSCMSDDTNSPEVGLQLYTVRDAMSNDPVRTLKKIASIGYSQIETANFENGKSYGFAGTEFKRVLDDMGLKLISGHFSPKVFENSFEEALAFMVAAEQQYAVFPWLSNEQRMTISQYKAHAETLNKCGELAKSAGVTVCYHNHAFEFETLEGLLPINVLLKETDPNLVKFELDLYWVKKAGFDPIRFFKENEGLVPLWHVKDMDDTPDQFFTEVGEGVIDFKSIFAAKEVSGMKHFFVEQDQSIDPLQSIEKSYKNLTSKILSQ